jgi:hypothetical protein
MAHQSTSSIRSFCHRAGLIVLATAFASVGPGAVIVSAAGAPVANDEAAVRRLDDGDEDLALATPDDDPDDGFSPASTRTSNADGDSTRGNDGTNGGPTRTNDRDGDDTRGNDGTGSGDGGTRTSNRDGDGTRGNDGTSGAATKTRDGDGDGTRGSDDTSGGSNTSGGTNTSTGGGNAR